MSEVRFVLVYKRIRMSIHYRLKTFTMHQNNIGTFFKNKKLAIEIEHINALSMGHNIKSIYGINSISLPYNLKNYSNFSHALYM